jgi:hypothetical protein
VAAFGLRMVLFGDEVHTEEEAAEPTSKALEGTVS